MRTTVVAALVLAALLGCGKKPAPAAAAPPPAAASASGAEPELQATPLRLARRKVAEAPLLAPLIAYLYDPGAGALKPIRHRLVFTEVLKEAPRTNLGEVAQLDLRIRLCHELAEQPGAMTEYLESYLEYYRKENKDAEVDLATVLKAECKLSAEETKLYLEGR